VPGYSPYSEWRYFVEKGAAFRPNLVLLSFCVNDISDPALHWTSFVSRDTLEHLPEEAIPNAAYHRDHVKPLREQQQRRRSSRKERILRKSALYKRIQNALPGAGGAPVPPTVERGGKRWPAFVVGEDSLSIEVLASYESPEWVWLRSMYDKLGASVTASGASFAIVWNPASYQLDPDYPVKTQDQFARFCGERSLHCLDLLPALRDHRDDKPRLFNDTSPAPRDIWHYSPSGNRLVAGEIARFLEREKLLPAPKAPAPGG
jgi:hypothetical protein